MFCLTDIGNNLFRVYSFIGSGRHGYGCTVTNVFGNPVLLQVYCSRSMIFQDTRAVNLKYCASVDIETASEVRNMPYLVEFLWIILARSMILCFEVIWKCTV